MGKPWCKTQAAVLYAQLRERSWWPQGEFFKGFPPDSDGFTPVRELCNELRSLAAADGIVLEVTFDEFNVYAKTVAVGQAQLSETRHQDLT